jgi:hypothetical protein
MDMDRETGSARHRRLRWRAAVVCAFVMMTVLASPVRAFASDPSDWMINMHSGDCLTLQGSSNGTQAFGYYCTGLADQAWHPELVSPDSSLFRIVDENSGKCLVAQGYSNGAPVFQYDCLNFSDQLWQLSGSFRYDEYNNVYVQIQNLNSGKCLLVQYGLGTRAVQYDCLTFEDQYWNWPAALNQH